MGHQKKVASKAAQKSGNKNQKSSSSNNNKQNNSSSSSTALHEDEKDSSASVGAGAPMPIEPFISFSGLLQNRYKNYAGISGRSVKCYWEQYNSNQQDTFQEEVYMRVAEDVTYKLWELGNVSRT